MVVGEDIGPERGDAVLPGVVGEAGEEGGGDSALLIVIGHGEGRLGGLRVAFDGVITAHADQPSVGHGDERHPFVVVELGEMAQLVGVELVFDPEESLVGRLVRHRPHHGLQGVAVLRGDGTHAQRGAVAYRDIGDPRLRVAGGWIGHGHGGAIGVDVHGGDCPTPRGRTS